MSILKTLEKIGNNVSNHMPDDAEVGDAKDEGVDDAEDEDIMMMLRLMVWMMLRMMTL